MSESLQKMLEELGRAFGQAISTSTDCRSAMHRIQDEGFSLFLVLNRDEDSSTDTPSVAVDPTTTRPLSAEARFRLDTSDVAFLRSLGIDASRTGRQRRS